MTEVQKHNVRRSATAYLVGNCEEDRERMEAALHRGARVATARPSRAGRSRSAISQPSSHYTTVIAVGLQPVVEKMNKKWLASTTSSMHGAGVGLRKLAETKRCRCGQPQGAVVGRRKRKGRRRSGRMCALATTWFVRIKMKGEEGLVILFSNISTVYTTRTL
jgi:hypothetical protein